MKPELATTQDGSHTLISDIFGVHYHSIHGALEESIHVFISAGLYYLKNKGYNKIKIFEMGFGTGLNAYLSMLESVRLSLEIEYVGIEKYPIPIEQSLELNYPQVLNSNPDIFQKMHAANWGQQYQLSNRFSFKKLKEDIQEYEFDFQYDLIFFDAFAPSAQSFLWERELHEKLKEKLNTNGCLVTYCAQGKFKRMLKALGYRLESLNGPGRKHEMTRAIKE